MFKHQTDSFRNRNGARFVCANDFCEENAREQAKEMIRSYRENGKKAFYEHHRDGYYKVFVEK